jgi:hypothetical protein
MLIFVGWLARLPRHIITGGLGGGETQNSIIFIHVIIISV